jgi:hypothetical protein
MKAKVYQNYQGLSTQSVAAVTKKGKKVKAIPVTGHGGP